MSRRLFGIAPAAVLTSALAVLTATLVSAHVVRTFGPYTIAIGWEHEPTYAGELNAVQLIVKDAAGHPVNDLTSDELHVQISAAGLTSSTLSFDPSFDPDTGLGNPGEYDASVLPTVPGNYTFKLTASVHGTMIDQSFTSGPTTFDTVHDATSVEFPPGLPSLTQVNARVSRDLQRVQSALANADKASSSAGRATALAIAGLVAGVLLGGIAVTIALRSRRSA